MRARCFTFIVYPWLFERKVIALNEDEARRKLNKMLTKEQQQQQTGIVCVQIESVHVPPKADRVLIGIVIFAVVAFLVFLIVMVTINNERREQFRAECTAIGGITYEPYRSPLICLNQKSVIKP